MKIMKKTLALAVLALVMSAACFPCQGANAQERQGIPQSLRSPANSGNRTNSANSTEAKVVKAAAVVATSKSGQNALKKIGAGIAAVAAAIWGFFFVKKKKNQE